MKNHRLHAVRGVALLALLFSFVISVTATSTLFAQARDYHTQRVVLDDGAGHTTTVNAGSTTGTFTLPAGNGSTGQELSTDGTTNGGLSWITPSGGSSTLPSGTIVGFPTADAEPGFTYTGSSTVIIVGNSWATESSTGFTVRSALASSVVNGKIYAMGGENPGGVYHNTNEVYDPSTNTWATKSSTGFTARFLLTSSVVNGKIYAIGGTNNAGTLNTNEVYDPSTDTWATKSSTGFTAREGLASSVVNGKIYAMGGLNGSFLNTLEVFDPSTNTWSTPTTTGTFTGRAFLTSSVVNGKIYAMGGSNISSVLNTLEVFDPSTNTWSTPTTTGTFTARYGLTSSVVNGTIYAMGGYNGSYLNTNEAFTPALTIYAFSKN